MADVISVILRSLSFILALQAAGVAVFIAIFGRHIPQSRQMIRRLGRASAMLGAVAVAAHFFMEAARMAGELSGVLDPALQRSALMSASGAAFGLRLLALLLIGFALSRRDALSNGVGVVGATLLAASFTLVGHTSVHPARWILATALTLHLLIVAFWFGALLPLYLVSRSEPSSTTAEVARRFTRIATWLVPVIFMAGLALAVLLVPNLAVLRQPYGELLLTKILAFAVLMALAALNKWRLGPAVARDEPLATRALRRSVGAEYILIVGVLCVTAVMTAFFSPE